MGDIPKNFLILKRIGMSHWHLYDEDFKDFFNWFAQNITEHNILTDAEMRDYREIVKLDEVLTGVELVAELENVEEDYPGLLSATDSDVQQLKDELALLEEIDQNYDKLLSDMKTAKSSITDNITSTEKKLAKLEKQENELADSCKKIAKEVQDIQTLNQKKLIELSRCYAVDHTPPLSIHLMDMNEYYHKCDMFMQLMNLYVQEGLLHQSLQDVNVMCDVDKQQYVHQLEQLKEKMYHSTSNLIATKMDLCSQKSLIHNYTTTSWQPMTFVAMAKKISELRDRNRLCDAQTQMHQNTLNHVLRNFTNFEVDCIVYENSRQKMLRAQHKFDSLLRFTAIQKNAVLNDECLWILMQLDGLKIKQRKQCDLLDLYDAESRACRRRIDGMKISSFPSNQGHDSFLNQISVILCKLSTEDKTISSLYETLLRDVEETEKMIGSNQLYRSVDTLLEQSDTMAKQIRQFINDGAGPSPNLNDQRILNEMFTLSIHQTSVDKKMADFKLNYKQLYARPMSDDHFFYAQQCLWIWFLYEPNKIHRACQMVQRAANEVEKSKGKQLPPKHISGIRRRE